MAARFEWPTPPYHSVTGDESAPIAEDCDVALADGARVTGKLVRLALSDSSVSILPRGEPKLRTIGIPSLHHVVLPRPIRIVRDESPLADRTTPPPAPSERQSFSLEFADGERLEGRTSGYVNTRQGVFLFVPDEDGNVIRHFYSRARVRNLRIGLPIGETLIEENGVAREDVEAALETQERLRSMRIGDYLTESLVVSREQLERALAHQHAKPMLRLGEALLQLGVIDRRQLEEALALKRDNRRLPIGRILLNMGVIDEAALKKALTRKLGIPFVGLESFNFDHDALKLVPASVAQRLSLIPLCLSGDGAIVVALEDPMNATAIEEIRFITQKRVIPAMACVHDIERAINHRYGRYGSAGPAPSPVLELAPAPREEFELPRKADAGVDSLVSRLPEPDAGLALVDTHFAGPETVLVQLINKMILDAWSDGVSDIHVESYPGKKGVVVRFRKDGTLIHYADIPSDSRATFVSRIKVMTRLDIAERRRPQDGKLSFREFGAADVELRVTTIPTTDGLEDVVMRLLSGSRLVPFDELGLDPEVASQLRRIVVKPHGLVLACGPTGSGKSTTLHSLLGTINTTERKIWTAEDPVEISHPGLRQVQVNSKIGWTFDAAMRSFLRADPDVIMIGEMRDAVTAHAVLEASLTGHLVFSTLHTNSAPESIVRLLDLGLDPFNFADAMLAILAQRLARALCPHCREKRKPAAGELEELAAEYCEGDTAKPDDVLARWRDESGDADGPYLYRAVGCRECNGTGYRGRTGLHELLVMTPALRHLVQTRAPMNTLFAAARATGMRSLKQDGIRKVLAGVTDIGNVRAVCS